MSREIAQFWGGGPDEKLLIKCAYGGRVSGKRFLLGLEALDFAHAGKGAADVGNGNGTADDQGDIERVNDFFPAPAFFRGADEVVSDAVVTAKDGGGDQSKQLLGLRAERTGFIGLMIEREEALDAEMAAAEDLFVEVGTGTLEVVE